MALDPRLLEILVCPACRAPVRAVEDESALLCGECGRSYPVRDGIPAMLLDEASGPDEPGSTGRSGPA